MKTEKLTKLEFERVKHLHTKRMLLMSRQALLDGEKAAFDTDTKLWETDVCARLGMTGPLQVTESGEVTGQEAADSVTADEKAP